MEIKLTADWILCEFTQSILQEDDMVLVMVKSGEYIGSFVDLALQALGLDDNMTGLYRDNVGLWYTERYPLSAFKKECPEFCKSLKK